MDLRYVGSKFTWARHFENGNSIWERLDRGLANNGWFLKFPGARVHHLQCNSSDHCPFLIVLAPLDIPLRKKPFRFEEIWLSNPSCGEVVQVAWESTVGSDLSNEILAKIEKCGLDLMGWNRNVFGNVRNELIKKKELLRKAELVAQVSGVNHRVRELKTKIDVLMDREARMWAQRSRLLWAGHSDKNTRYFHSRATKRFRKNQIRGIRDEMDVWRTEPDEIAIVLTGYYQNLFTTSSPENFSNVLEHVPQLITDEMNSYLSSEFLECEVSAALNQMAPLKALGLGGMPSLFYQHFWGLVDKDVSSSILSWLNTGTLPHPVNHTFITLIPKTENPEYVTHFRPISLCNVLYKIFSKVLGN